MIIAVAEIEGREGMEKGERARRKLMAVADLASPEQICNKMIGGRRLGRGIH
jgi:hypothetical protein